MRTLDSVARRYWPAGAPPGSWHPILAIAIAIVVVPTVFARPGGSANLSEDRTLSAVGLPDAMKYLIVGNSRFDPLAEGAARSASLPTEGVETTQPAYYIVQFNRPVTKAMKDGLGPAGATVLHFVPYNGFVVRADRSTIEDVTRLPWVRWAGPFDPAFKLSPRLADEPRSSSVGESAGETRAGPVLYAGEGLTPPSRTLNRVGNGGPSDGASRLRVIVLPFERSELPDVLRAIQSAGGKAITWSQRTTGIVRAEVPKNAIDILAREPGVMWIDRETRPYVFNDIARWAIQGGNGATFATPIHDRGILGTGQIVTVADTGVDYQHDAFEDPSNPAPGPGHRKLTAYYTPADGVGDTTDNDINHGTHVAGTIAGDDGTWHVYDGDPSGSGATTGPHDGQAFDAKLQVQDFSVDGFYIQPPTDLSDMYAAALAGGSYFHSNSWGDCCGDYITEASQTDRFVWENPDFIVLFAGGNSGSSLNTLNTFGAAKNVIAVGASDNGISMNNVAYFSSRGPATDGRLKPDLLAPGSGIWSAHGCDPGPVCDNYFQLSGTSMATPTAAGAAVLVRQYYTDGWYPTGEQQATDGFRPSAALVKATLINGAAEMTGAGAYENGETRYPNFNQGWGRVLLDDALFFAGETRALLVDDRRVGISTADTVIYQIAISDAQVPLEVTLVWTDYPGTPLSDPNLVNDLDLVVVAPDGTTYRGNRYAGYNPGESQPNPAEADHLNNVEGVLVRSRGQVGIWTVQVSGFNVPMGPQPYALVLTGAIAKQRGTVQMDRNSYRSSATINVTVIDTDLNTNPSVRDTATTSMSSTTEADPEVVTVTETGSNTGIFKGSVRLQNSGAPLRDGLLQARNGDTVTATYFDMDDGRGGSGPTSDTATVDDTPPAISGVTVSGLRWFRATVEWITSESADGSVLYDAGIPPRTTKSDSRRTTSHSITLTGLAPSTTYYFAVQSTDEAGNLAVETNSGAYYRFATPPRPPDATPSPEWPEFHHSRERDGVGPVPYAMPLAERWNTTLGSRIRWSGPVIEDRTVFFTEREGTVNAIDLGTGSLKWQVALGSPNSVHGTPSVGFGKVYVALVTNAGDGITLYALDKATGSVVWKAQVPAPAVKAMTTPVLDESTIYWYDGTGRKLRANDAESGEFRWTYTMPDRGFLGPTYWAGIVFATDAFGNVIALDAVTGEELWKTSLGSPITSAPTLSGGVLYVGSYAGTVAALDPLSGERLWTSPLLGQVIDVSSPAVAAGRVFIGAFVDDTTGSMYALDASTGAIVWSYPLPGGPIGASPVYNNGTVFVPAWDGFLYAWDAATGNLLQKAVLSPAGSSSSPALGDGFLVLGDDAGKLTAFGFVGAGEVRRIVATPASTSLAVGTSAILEAGAYDAYDNRLGGFAFAWTSLDGLGTILPVTDSSDRVMYTAGTVAGSDRVRVAGGAASATINVNVAPGPAARLSISPGDPTVEAGGTLALTATGTDVYGNVIPVSAGVIWSSSAGQITPGGILTGPTTAGYVVVSATVDGLRAQVVVLVTPSALEQIMVLPSSLNLAVGRSTDLTATARDRHGNEITDATFVWSATIGSIEVAPDGRSAVFHAGQDGGRGEIRVSSGSEATVVEVLVSVPNLPPTLLSLPLEAYFIIIGLVILSTSLAVANRRSKRRATEAAKAIDDLLEAGGPQPDGESVTRVRKNVTVHFPRGRNP